MMPLAKVFFHSLRRSVHTAKATARKPRTAPMPTVTRSFRKLWTLILRRSTPPDAQTDALSYHLWQVSQL